VSLGGWFLCHVFGDHDWTNKHQQGIKPDRDRMRTPEESVTYFNDYVKMYCARCGTVSDLCK
jgi:hypothetical protein